MGKTFLKYLMVVSSIDISEMLALLACTREEQYLERHLLAKHTYHNIWKGVIMSKKSWQQIIKKVFFSTVQDLQLLLNAIQECFFLRIAIQNVGNELFTLNSDDFREHECKPQQI